MNIKPGMICMVASGHNAGRECTVIRWLNAGECVPEVKAEILNDAWFIQGPNIEAKSRYGFIYVDGYGAENHLIPLGFDTIVKSEVTEHDVARQTNKDALLPERA